MTWDRKTSDLEAKMVEVIKRHKKPLSLVEIVAAIEITFDHAFSGKTPVKSLYSIIYRRERRRISKGVAPLFKTQKDRRVLVYSLNKIIKGKQ